MLIVSNHSFAMDFTMTKSPHDIDYEITITYQKGFITKRHSGVEAIRSYWIEPKPGSDWKQIKKESLIEALLEEEKNTAGDFLKDLCGDRTIKACATSWMRCQSSGYDVVGTINTGAIYARKISDREWEDAVRTIYHYLFLSTGYRNFDAYEIRHVDEKNWSRRVWILISKVNNQLWGRGEVAHMVWFGGWIFGNPSSCY